MFIGVKLSKDQKVISDLTGHGDSTCWGTKIIAHIQYFCMPIKPLRKCAT